MKGKLFITDKQNNASNRAAWEKQRQTVQDVVNAYNAVGLPSLGGAEELHRLFNNTKDFLYAKLSGGEVAKLVMGDDLSTTLPINQSAAMELISKPKGYTELISLIEKTAQEVQKGIEWNNLAKMRVEQISQIFNLDAAGNVCFSESHQHNINEYGNRYLKSKTGENLAVFLEKIEQAYKECGLDSNRLCTQEPMRIIASMTNRWDATNNRFERNESFVVKDAEYFNLEQTK
jgi:hypothetical protein